MKSLAAERDRKKNNFPFSIFNARKIIFTIIAAFSTIKTVLFALWRAAEDEEVARPLLNFAVFRRLEKVRRHQLKSLKHPKKQSTPFRQGPADLSADKK
jgi:hypothetical protein